MDSGQCTGMEWSGLWTGLGRELELTVVWNGLWTDRALDCIGVDCVLAWTEVDHGLEWDVDQITP